MPFFDFVEIGTSDFDTELQAAGPNERGLSIDPLQVYLDRLPDKPNCTKFCAAVSDSVGEIDVYSLPPDRIQKLGMGRWIRGCNSVGAPHPTVVRQLRRRGLNPDELIVASKVEMIDFLTLAQRFSIEGINFLKVDTEGHDHIILHSYCDLIENKPELKAHRIKFESNVLTTPENVTAIRQRLIGLGYEVAHTTAQDTIMVLQFEQMDASYQPIDRSHPEIEAAGPFDGYYLKGYPPGYRLNSHPNTLVDALIVARRMKAGGVTLQNGRYEVRGRKLIQLRGCGAISWVVKL